MAATTLKEPVLIRRFQNGELIEEKSSLRQVYTRKTVSTSTIFFENAYHPVTRNKDGLAVVEIHDKGRRRI